MLLTTGCAALSCFDEAVHHGIKPLSGDFGVDLVAQGVTHLDETVRASIFVQLVCRKLAQRVVCEECHLVEQLLEAFQIIFGRAVIQTDLPFLDLQQGANVSVQLVLRFPFPPTSQPSKPKKAAMTIETASE